MENSEKSEKFWDSIAKSYDKTENFLDQIFRKIQENTIKYLKTTDIVLDFACGTGTSAIEFAPYVNMIHGIDISNKMLELAGEKAKKNNIENILLTKTTLFDENLRKESFNVVLAFGILHLLENSRQVVYRIADLLKPGGLLITAVPCLAEKMSLLTRVKFYPALIASKMGIIPGTLKRFKYYELDNLITTKNLQIVDSEKIFYEMSAYYVVVQKI